MEKNIVIRVYLNIRKTQRLNGWIFYEQIQGLIFGELVSVFEIGRRKDEAFNGGISKHVKQKLKIFIFKVTVRKSQICKLWTNSKVFQH